MRFYLENVTLYYAQTNFQKQYLVDEGFDSNRIEVIPNMVDGSVVENEERLGGYVAFAGRVSPEKGVVTLTEAASICGNVSFKLAGEYTRMPGLIFRVTKNVELLGHLGKMTLGEFYKSCRVFVMPSIWYEGFPGVIIEAMLYGKPVICSRIGGLPEIVEDGQTGFLFNPGDAADLADKINYLYSRPELCRTMGAAGRKKVLEEYSSVKYYARLMAVYDRALESNS
jgi:glycosyltransferase involved in cell wall biosynthesis